MRLSSSANGETRRHALTGLETERLTLRALSLDDVDALWKTLGNAQVQRHYVDLAENTSGWSRPQTAQFIEECLAGWQQWGFGRWGVELRDTHALVGYCGLAPVTWLPAIEPAIEIGFRLHPTVWGRGLAGEAACAALTFAFNQAQLHDVVACYVPENLQSSRVVEKLGFVYEQTVPYVSPISGRSTEFRVHRMTRAQWNRKLRDK